MIPFSDRDMLDTCYLSVSCFGKVAETIGHEKTPQRAVGTIFRERAPNISPGGEPETLAKFLGQVPSQKLCQLHEKMLNVTDY